MIIAVSGLSGSGKNTFGKALAEELGYHVVCPTFKDLAEKEGVSLLEFQKKAGKMPEIDRKFDEMLKEKASEGECVVTTWLGPWMVDADFRVWVDAPQEVRAKRLAERDGFSFEDALEHIKQRDADNRARYLKLYNIDIMEHGKFDLEISSEENRPEEMVKIAIRALKEKGLLGEIYGSN
ncbi:AAA family ATPase [Candidatus Micrarchaeota archaeon]|nr:AAA family ATPase [Candidatus Micrarchaeota archaeon]MBD3418295.1 AAA family ATPase [Candidatus Micrarchaeota archaeon]